MKRSVWILFGSSFLANIALIAVLVARSPLSPQKQHVEGNALHQQSLVSSADHARSKSARSASDSAALLPGTAGSTPRTTWQRMSSTDPATFAANLRAAGFSLGATRGAIYALLRDLQTAERIKAVELVPIEPFWKPITPSVGTLASGKEVGRLWHERDRIMRSIFPEEQQAYTLRGQIRFGPLSSETLEKLALLDQDYADMRRDAMGPSASGFRMPWAADQLALLEAEKRKDVAALLTPQELAEYDLRTSPTARTLQRQLAGFNPTEQEYRDIYRLRAAHDEQMRTAAANNASSPAAAQQELTKQIKTLLGESRYADYERSTDPAYQAANSVVQQLALPATTVAAVYQVQQDVRKREEAIRRNTAQTPAQRDAQLAALTAESKTKLTELLTAKGYDQYRLQSGGGGQFMFESGVILRP